MNNALNTIKWMNLGLILLFIIIGLVLFYFGLPVEYLIFYFLFAVDFLGFYIWTSLKINLFKRSYQGDAKIIYSNNVNQRLKLLCYSVLVMAPIFFVAFLIEIEDMDKLMTAIFILYLLINFYSDAGIPFGFIKLEGNKLCLYSEHLSIQTELTLPDELNKISMGIDEIIIQGEVKYTIPYDKLNENDLQTLQGLVVQHVV